MEFTIDRSKWRCGGDSSDFKNRLGGNETYLLNEDGYMCCLGQCAFQSGIKETSLLELGTPSDVQVKIPVLTRIKKWHPSPVVIDTLLSKEAMQINDDEYTTVAEKERLLTKLFKKHKHQITFIN